MKPVVEITLHKAGMVKLKPSEFLGYQFITFQETCFSNGAVRKVEGSNVTYLVTLEKFPALREHLSREFELIIHKTVEEKVSAAVEVRDSNLGRLSSLFKALEEAGLPLPTFQQEDIYRIADAQAILDRKDPGLGKTVTDVLAVPVNAKVIVITLASMKYTYHDEIIRWRRPLEVVSPRVIEKAVDGMTFKEGPDWQVYNYEKLPGKRWCENIFPKVCPEGLVVIVDEAQKASNEKTQIYAKVKAICHAALDKGGKIILASGTPMQNHPGELWNVLELARLGTKLFGGRKQFVVAFGGVEGEYGVTWGNPTPEVVDVLKAGCIVRHKRECLASLPPTRTQYIPVRVGRSVKSCDTVWESLRDPLLREGNGLGFLRKLYRGKLAIPFQEYAKVRADLARAKIGAMQDLVRNHCESGVPLIVASNHLAPLRALQEMDIGAGEWGDSFPVIQGKTSAKERKRIVDDFQSGLFPVLGLSIKAGGTGITLTRASTMLFVDLHWNPAVNQQCMGRVDRMGQLNPVLYQVLVGSHDLDLYVTEVLLGKEIRLEKTWKSAA